MALEIEHKYLVKDDSYKEMAQNHTHILQGYLSREPDRTVRVRVKGERGFITVKGRNSGDVRLEFEYEVPKADAEEMLGLCLPPVLEKVRWEVKYEGKLWEVDEFLGSLAPLVTAEIELTSSAESYSLPSFVGKNVTGDPRYYNSQLPACPGL